MNYGKVFFEVLKSLVLTKGKNKKKSKLIKLQEIGIF